MDYLKSEATIQSELARALQQEYRELTEVELALIGGGIGDVIVA